MVVDNKQILGSYWRSDVYSVPFLCCSSGDILNKLSYVKLYYVKFVSLCLVYPSVCFY